MVRKTQTKKVEFSFIELVGICLMIIFIILIIASSLLAQKDLHQYRGPNFRTTDNLRCDSNFDCYTVKIYDLKLNEPVKIGNYYFEIINGDTKYLKYVTVDINGVQHNFARGTEFSDTENYYISCLSLNNSDDPWYNFQGKFLIEVKQ